MLRRTAVAAACMIVILIAPALPAQAASTKTITGTALLAKLTVKAESHAGSYDRDKDFGARFLDANGDCQDTRSEVLQKESTKKVTYYSKKKCAVATGKWLSWYDEKTWTKASDVDIDHVVALAEVWRSGGWDWTQARRLRYANDLGYSWTLDAVTDNVNESKGDNDPADWLPDNHVCKYARHWVAIKYRWKLSIDTSEHDALAAILTGHCGDLKLTLPKRAS